MGTQIGSAPPPGCHPLVYLALLCLASICLVAAGGGPYRYPQPPSLGFLLPPQRHSPRLPWAVVAGPRVGGRLFAGEGENEGVDGKKSKSRKRRRVRKDQKEQRPVSSPQPQQERQEAEGEGGEGTSWLEMQQRQMLEERDEIIQSRASDAIKRDFGGSLILEEFATAEEIIFDEDVDPLRVMPVNDFKLPIPSESGVATPLSKASMKGAIDITKMDREDFKKEFSSTLPSLPDLAKRDQTSEKKALRQQQKEEEAARAAKALEPITEYSLSSAVLGESRPIIGIELPFLQSGHLVVLGFSLLCAFIDYPGLPFTELPDPFREFFQQGLLVVYLINAVLAFFSIGAAQARDQNAIFWAGKTFLLGGLAFQELNLIAEKKRSSV